MGPKIRMLIFNEEFDSRLHSLALAAWNASKLVITNFLENHRHDQYADIDDRILKASEQLGAPLPL